jgi:hypothetical protein
MDSEYYYLNYDVRVICLISIEFRKNLGRGLGFPLYFWLLPLLGKYISPQSEPTPLNA